jgi:uncharacterized protein YkwD
LQTDYARPDQRYEFGEALGYNYSAAAIPARMIVQILRSSLHRAKLLARRFQHVGVGIAPAPPFPRPGHAGATYTIDVGLRSP